MIRLLDGTVIRLSNFTDITDYTGERGTGLSPNKAAVHIDVLSWFANEDYAVFYNKDNGFRVLVYKHSISCIEMYL